MSFNSRLSSTRFGDLTHQFVVIDPIRKISPDQNQRNQPWPSAICFCACATACWADRPGRNP
jgi:hypothetical protein